MFSAITFKRLTAHRQNAAYLINYLKNAINKDYKITPVFPSVPFNFSE